MKRLTIALSLALMSTGALASGKSGIAVGLGLMQFNGELGSSLKRSHNTHDKAFSLQADYTFENGVIVGAMLTTTKHFSPSNGLYDSLDQSMNSGALYMGYQFDNGVRLKLGSSKVVYDETYIYRESNGTHSQEDLTLKQRGLYLGLGWVTSLGLFADIGYTKLNAINMQGQMSGHSYHIKADGGFTQFTLGYKF